MNVVQCAVWLPDCCWGNLVDALPRPSESLLCRYAGSGPSFVLPHEMQECMVPLRCQALCGRLSTPSRPLRQVCPDDSRTLARVGALCAPSPQPMWQGMDLMNGNTLALLVAPDGLFAGTDSKRARLHERVAASQLCVECLYILQE